MKSALTLLFWIDVLFLNLGIGYLFFKKTDTLPPVVLPKSEVSYVDECGVECKKYIDSVVRSTPIVTAVSTIKPSPTSILPTAAVNKVRRVSYVTTPGNGGGTIQTDWVDVGGSDFYFDTKDYPGLVEIYFESTMQLVNGSGMAYVRLFDVTHGIGVQGSEIQTSSNVSTIVVSGKLNPWAGRNLMRVQVKSLTTETAQFVGGRLRVVTEN